MNTEEDLPAGKLKIAISYLEMRERPQPRELTPPSPKINITPAINPTVSFYRYLYNTVDGPWLWYARRRMSDEQLRGIMPEFIGQRLGPFLLEWIITKAWSYNPQRFWLHTCTLDHPKALAIYQQAGFVPYKREEKTVDDPRALGLI